MTETKEPDFYETLGVSVTATSTEVRRAYRNLITKEHPDKGGDAAKFSIIQRAYDVLSSDTKRKQYDTTGTFEKSADEELLDSFGGGAFRDKMKRDEAKKETLAEALVKREEQKGSHTAGFDSFMRSRGESVQTYGVDEIINMVGVVKGSYEEVALPKIRAFQVTVTSLSGPPSKCTKMVSEAIPSNLEWGEVLVNVRAAPVNAADLNPSCGADLPGMGGAPPLGPPPYVGGNDGIATVVKVGPGIKSLNEGDWVMPFKAGMGTWRSLAVWKEKDVVKIPADLLPLEYAAVMREMCTAFRLLEDFGDLKPGDAVILNAATGAVGTTVIQLCSMLKLRAVAVVRPDAKNQEKTEAWLRSLGAVEVLPDQGSLAEELDRRRFYAKPKLALDAVGGASAVRLADALHDSSPLIVYGNLSLRAATFPWNSWITRSLIVRGFSLRLWMNANKKKVPKMMETLAKLVNAGKLNVEMTDYELSTESEEALEHAAELGRNTKVMLKVNDIGQTYDK